MTTRDIVDTFEEMYGATISATQVSNITEAIMEKIIVTALYNVSTTATLFNSMNAVCFNLYLACEYALAVVGSSLSHVIASLTPLCNDFTLFLRTNANTKTKEKGKLRSHVNAFSLCR